MGLLPVVGVKYVGAMATQGQSKDVKLVEWQYREKVCICT